MFTTFWFCLGLTITGHLGTSANMKRRTMPAPFIYDQTAQMTLESYNADTSARPCKHATWIVGDACIAYLDTPKIMCSDRSNTYQEAGEKIASRHLEYYIRQPTSLLEHPIQANRRCAVSLKISFSSSFAVQIFRLPASCLKVWNGIKTA